MKTLLFVVVPVTNVPFNPDDGHAVRALQSMFHEQILGFREIAVAYYGGDLALKYAMVLALEPAKSLFRLPDEFAGNFGLTLTKLCEQYAGSEYMLCVAPANTFLVTLADGLVKRELGADISGKNLRMMEATTHDAFLFTADRKGVPVIVNFLPKVVW